MKKTGIFYGSTTGTTHDVATRLARILDIADADVHYVSETALSAVAAYDRLLLGTSTWGDGELQSDWENFINGLEVLDLNGKEVAIFGCGDETMSETFCNGVGEIYERVVPTGATIKGAYPADCYDFEHSRAVVDGGAVGLLLDEVNHPELTDLRLRSWCDAINK